MGSKHPKSLLHIYFHCLLVGLFPINVKTAEPIGPKFCVGPQKRIMDARNYKTLYPKVFDFCEILKIREKLFENPGFCLLLFYILQREDAKCSQIEQQLKLI